MNIKKKIHLLVLIGLIINFTSCRPFASAIVKGSVSKEKKTVPIDFGKDDSYLIVLNDTKIGKYAYKKLNQRYTGNFVGISADDLDSDKYADKEKYRYVIVSRKIGGEYSVNSLNNTAPSGSTLNIYDRFKNKTYRGRMSSGSWKGVVNAYVSKLESIRLQQKQSN